MGLFGNKDIKEQKRLEQLNIKEQKQLEQLNIKMHQLGLENLSLEEKKQAELILYNFWGTGLASFGASADDSAKISLAKAQIEQNWLLLRKLDSIEKELKKLNEK